VGKQPDLRDPSAIDEVRKEVFAGREPVATICELGMLVKPAARVGTEGVPIRTK